MRRVRTTSALFAMALTLGTAGIAHGQCALPYTLTNGTPADATQVMANYNALVTCLFNNGSVGTGTMGQIGFYAGNGSAISGLGVSDLLDQTFSSTRGTILYRGVSGWAALAPGTSGFLLQSGGTGADPSWVAGGGGGGGITAIVAGGVSAGTATVGLASGPVIVRPAAGAFTWLNQASATVTDHTDGPLVLRTVQNTGGAVGINALLKSVAGSDWTVTIQYALGNHTAGLNIDSHGLVIYNSVNGRFFTAGLDAPAAALRVWQYNSTTSFNALAAGKAILVTPQSVWTRAKYTSSSTTLAFYHSIDGLTWEQVYTTASPFVGVPTHYGIAVGSQGNSSGYILSLNYMVESSP